MCNHVWWWVLTRLLCWLFHNIYKYRIISCTPEPNTMFSVNYTSVKNISDANWQHGSVIPMTPRAASRKAKSLGPGGSVVARLKLKEPRSHAEVGGEPGERGNLEFPWRQSFQTEGVSNCALCCWILSQMSKEKWPSDLAEGRWLLTLARVFPWVAKTNTWSLWVEERPWD